jgi:excisionase family DNA binding protein
MEDDIRLPRLLTIAQCHQRTGLSTSYLYQLVAARLLPAHKLGTAIRISDEDLIAYLDSTRTAKAPTVSGETFSAGAASGELAAKA